MFYAYVLRSDKNGRNYYGSTNNLNRRLYEHNIGHTQSLKYMRPLRIIYFEEFKSLVEARNREKFFKSGKGREFIKKLVKN